jgi:outer membrane protein OmpA-like peptidoglycan-associated protein
MNSFLKSLIWFLLFAFLAALIHFYFIQKKCGGCGDSNFNQSKSVQLTDFVISDADGNTIFKFPKGFVINSIDGKVEIPTELNSLRDSVFNYLNRNQDKELIITGKYLSSEGEPRGLDRANFLKNFLVKFGANGDKIVPKTLLSDYSYNSDNKYENGIGMVFQNISQENQKVIEDNITEKTLYSAFGDADFQPDNTLIAYAQDLKSYLAKHLDKKVIVTGHTDNVGGNAANQNLGLVRANTVTDYLISQGIDRSVFTTNSKGEDEPIADNASKDGRAQNRRITISLK